MQNIPSSATDGDPARSQPGRRRDVPDHPGSGGHVGVLERIANGLGVPRECVEVARPDSIVDGASPDDGSPASQA